MRLGRFHIGLSPAPRRRAYDAAKAGRLTSDWVYSHMSADQEIKAGLERIRDRARDLERNNDYARRYLSLVESNVVGKAGFSLRLAVPEPLAEQAAMLRAGFQDWLDQADVSGQLDGPSLQRIVIRSTARDGEALALIRHGKGHPDGIGIMLRESDYLATKETDFMRSLSMGVQSDDNGRPSSYLLYTKHPGDTYASAHLRDYPASEVIHVYRAERPGQRRAVSWLTSAILPLRMLAGYQEAELVAARVSACKMGFYKVPPGDDWGGDGEDGAGNPVTDAAPGVFERMPAGWEFENFDPKHPTTQYGAFVKSILREIAAGLTPGVSYAALANDGSDANYSSMREMSILEREGWMVIQQWFARAFMRRLYREWLSSVEDSGKFKFDLSPFETADNWTGRSWPWVDPGKDATAREQDVAMRLTAPSVLAAEKGVDYAEMSKQAAADEAMREKDRREAFDAADLKPEAEDD